MRSGIKDQILKWAIRVLVLGIFVVGLITVWPTFLRSRSLQRQEAELDRRIAAKRAEIDKLIQYQKRFKTDRDFVEMIARQPQNRRVFPGELVFVFEEKDK